MFGLCFSAQKHVYVSGVGNYMHIICSVQYAFISWVKHVQSYVGHTLKTFWRHFDVLTASVDNVAPQVRRHEKFQRACHACCVQLESRPWAADIFSIPKLRRGMAIDWADGSFQCRWNVCEAKPILASHLLINHVDPVPSSGARFRPVEVGCFRHLFCRLGRCSIWYRWCLPIHRCLLQRSRSTGYSVFPYAGHSFRGFQAQVVWEQVAWLTHRGSLGIFSRLQLQRFFVFSIHLHPTLLKSVTPCCGSGVGFVCFF